MPEKKIAPPPTEDIEFKEQIVPLRCELEPLRKRRKFNKTKLCTLAGISSSHYENLCKGSNPHLLTCRNLAFALGCSIEDIWPDLFTRK